MSRQDFRRYGKETVDYIANYMETIQKRRVVPAIEPGYLKNLIPTEAPSRGEPWEKVMDDFEKFIMPGVTHWQHPRFHAYFPAGNSYPSILANLLSDALGCVGFSWASCPAFTELELIMLHWFGKMIGLPKEFLPLTEGGKGGGVIQGSASECNFVSLLAARFEVMKELRQRFPFVEEGLLLSKLIAYCSKEAHSSVEKACMIGMVKLRILETDSKFRLRGDTLRNAIQEDRNLGLIPFFVSTTLGTTSCCSFDMLSEIGPVCQENELWLHVDAAYAGSAMICPEFRHLMNGIEYAMSFNTNPNKWMLVNFDCSTMWVKDRFKLTQALVVDPLYLQHSWMDKSIDYRHWGIPLSRRFRSLKLWLWLHVDAAYAGSAMICPEFRHLMNGIEYAMSFNTNPNKWMLVNFDCSTMWVKDRFKLTQALVVDPLYLQHSWMDKSIDYRHWGIPLSRRFRSLKLWFVIRSYGVEGLQNYIREHVRLAKRMEMLLRADPVFEIVGEVIMGLVCFRMRGNDERNQQLLTRLNSSGRIHMVPASLNDRFVIRFCVCAENASENDIDTAYNIISQTAQHILREYHYHRYVWGKLVLSK
ncbi:unnamed protein product [Haemonchus placei]|uniref:Aromatic-L-amino-acid decarboxylase n=2 Tax=Haemonchus placei TaxID=6290 RepID=A0A0N4XBE3_HAEPC|nr:unnamed protein product [Haemonchus placei]